MLRQIWFLLIVYYYSLICQATPMIGEQVRLAKKDEFPFVVSLSFSPELICAILMEVNHICTGSLITRQHVLTAAHCIDELGNKYSEVVVKVGSTDWKKADIYQVKTWITYDDWPERNKENPDAYYDMAIVTLKRQVNANIQLATITSEIDANLYNRTAMTAGWGLIENNVTPRHMRTAELVVIDPRQLPFSEMNFPERFQFFIPKMYFFTKAEPPVKLGCGDSGGPLLINNKEIIGINTNCWPDAVVDMPIYRNMHARVNFFKKFIANVICINSSNSCNIL